MIGRARPTISAAHVVIAMDIDKVAHTLERAQAHALPGREAAERNVVLRELCRKLQESKAPVRFVKRTWLATDANSRARADW
jgi:hypothetical protein